ncbi:hypothetical protein [Solilutibacter silvestris]|uniref:Uncharacterized protein n=1 Tax=Solilutibacter silvestris TaxID=1645665 RepID=A0A2K1PY87_9GAMM|nr:hypothetical protein [Lysobacter silvestris]PNS07740.1 hypothetical protein Lysil_1916 [Lysobacter silvestris]
MDTRRFSFGFTLALCAALFLPGIAIAQQASNGSSDTTTPATPLKCDMQGCVGKGGPLFQIRAYGETQSKALGNDPDSLQQNRRVETVAGQYYKGESKVLSANQAVISGRFSVDLPQGGTLWATEDPTLGQAILNVATGSLAPFNDGRVTEPLRFHAYSNYAAFYQRLEVLIYRGTDSDRVRPLATIIMPVGAVTDAQWDGELPAGLNLQAGDSLQYVARAYAQDGSFDETNPRTIQLVTPAEHARGAQGLRDQVQRTRTETLDTSTAESLQVVDSIYGKSDLRLHNIPVYGSRVRIMGRDIPEGMQVYIDGQNFPIDLERKFVAEFLQPIGMHQYKIQAKPSTGPVADAVLDMQVTGRYAFVAAIADLTFSHNTASGSTDALSGDARDASGFLSEGRLAFYAKGKWRGKYLITAQADTGENKLGNLFDGFFDATPNDIFRRLDPDQYYPVYGDDSRTWRDVDTQGKFYLRVDWNQNQALWGNFITGFTGTQYAQYQRALYGAALSWRSQASTALGDPRSLLKIFGAETHTAAGHSEFLGTGGSLYYLRHTDVLPGSEQVVLEVRDPATGSVETRVGLQSGVDYEMDNLQGRLILTRPLAQITRESVRTLTRDTPLDGYRQMLLVDYEYVPSGFNGGNATVGLRGKQWFGNHLAVGATYVDENRSGDDYSLKGVDLTLQAGRGTYLKVETTHTQSTVAPIFYSDNGGLSFIQRNPADMSGARSGTARSVEARANLQELGWTKREWSFGAWWRDVDSGFSISRDDTGLPTKEYGGEFLGYFTDHFSLYGRYSHAGRGTQELEQAQLTADWQITKNGRLGGELTHRNERDVGYAADATLLALSYRQRLGTSLELYGIGQYTVDDGGLYKPNNLLTLGGKYLFGNRSSVGAEVSGGSRGHGGKLDGEYQLSPDHSVYGAYNYSTDHTERDGLFNTALQSGWTLGQRWRLNNRVNVYNESQYLKSNSTADSGIVHTFGLDFRPVPGWNLGFTLMDGRLDSTVGRVDRHAYSITGGRTDPRLDWSSKLEYRRDRGAEQREQWVTTNRLSYRINEDWRLALRANYADTKDDLNPIAGARLAEVNAGFAWRPHDSTRWAAFGKYTYLYDRASLGQVDTNQYDQRSHVVSLEGIVQLDDHWQLAGKLASRWGDYRMGRGVGQWLDSRADFASLQIRYHLIAHWDGLAEYRVLKVRDGGALGGWLVGLDRQVSENFKVGVGYNFTTFSGDLTQLDYRYRGWFLNVTGHY